MADARARLDFTHDGRVARLTLAAPTANVLDVSMIFTLHSLASAVADRRDLCAVIVSADGPNFSFGASIEEHLPDRIAGALAALHGLLRRLASLPAPTLAAVRGQCLGGGFELALACDLVIAEEDARLGCPEIKLGVFPPAAAALLPVRIGAARATAMVLGGETLSGLEASTAGLVWQVVPPGSLDAGVELAIADAFQSRSAPALRLAAEAMRRPIRTALNDALVETERLYLKDLMREPDAEEGVRAFLEKRRPRWRST